MVEGRDIGQPSGFGQRASEALRLDRYTKRGNELLHAVTFTNNATAADRGASLTGALTEPPSPALREQVKNATKKL